jgi:zinc/manganese transport system substrate-binding protein
MGAPAPVGAAEPVRVVATFSILGDMVERIGGEHVSVVTLVGPNGDAHVYQPTPADARAVSEADLLVVNGLAFEGWLDRLVDASDFSGVRVVATAGIDPIPADAGHAHDEGHGHDHGEDHAENHDHGHDHDHDHGEDHGHDHDHDHAHDHDHGHGDDHDHGHDDHGNDHAHADDHDADASHGHHHGAFDPHAWQSLPNAGQYVDTIAEALAAADPANADSYEANRTAYRAEIASVDQDIRNMIAGLPDDRRTVVTSHDAFQYFGREYGLTFLAPQGVSTEAEASARDVARLIEQIRAENVPAVFVENITDPRLLERIADETGVTIGGTLYPGALSEPDGPAPTYLDMMRHNARTLAAALSS